MIYLFDIWCFAIVIQQACGNRVLMGAITASSRRRHVSTWCGLTKFSNVIGQHLMMLYDP